MINIKTITKQVIEVYDWDDLVSQTYGKPYNYQQQDGCKERQEVYISVPVEDPEDYKNDTVPEIVNGNKRGVSFKAWLERDVNQKIPKDGDFTDLWWERNFYPHNDMIINDLHSKGLLPSGEYYIDIDW